MARQRRRALELIEHFGDGFDLIRDPPEVRKLRRYLEEFSRYIDNNADLIPNYAERHRYGEVVSTAFVESTVNQAIAKRFAKKQQMQWTPRGSISSCNCEPASRRHAEQRFQALARGAAEIWKCTQVGRPPTSSCPPCSSTLGFWRNSC